MDALGGNWGGMANHLYYGDNLEVLREHVRDESVDLIYLDPPFNSNATYNVLFRGPSGDSSQAQIEAFEDTWHWNNAAERAFDEVMQGPNSDVANMLRAMRSFLNDNDMMAYLTHMAVRLVELHRVLKPTGSIYLHCDPTASHYLKVLMDAVWGGGTAIETKSFGKGRALTAMRSDTRRCMTPSCTTRRARVGFGNSNSSHTLKSILPRTSCIAIQTGASSGASTFEVQIQDRILLMSTGQAMALLTNRTATVGPFPGRRWRI